MLCVLAVKQLVNIKTNVTFQLLFRGAGGGGVGGGGPFFKILSPALVCPWSELGLRGGKVQQNGKMVAATMLVYSASFALPQDVLCCHGEVCVCVCV